MFFYLSKVLHFLITPLTWVFVLLLFSLFTRSSLAKRMGMLGVLLLLYFFSNSWVIDQAMIRYEGVGNETINELDTFDVAIVLGGFVSYHEEYEMENFYAASDRFLQALKWYKRGNVKQILISSGSGNLHKPEEKESLVLYNYLMTIGIPPKAILLESASKNTRENAINSAALLAKRTGKEHYLLITSASHMPRAKKCFDKAGLHTVPYSVDRTPKNSAYTASYLLLPHSANLRKWEVLLHEWIGLLVYKWMGYI